MRFLELQPGITINTNTIEGVEKEGNRTRVFAHRKTYMSDLPYETLISLLKEEVVDGNMGSEEKVKDTMDKLDKVLNKAQHFGG